MNQPLIKVYLVFICCLALIDVRAQDGYFKIDTVKSKDGELSFPILSSVTDSTSCKKINSYMKLSELRIGKAYYKDNLFEEISETGANHGYKTSLVFDISSNNKRVFSLSFSAVGGPIIEWEDTYDNFNSGNGELIMLSDLFSEQGFMKFKKIVVDQRIKQLVNLKDTNSPVQNYQSQIIENFKRDELNAFLIKDTSIYIYLNQSVANKYDNEAIKGKVIYRIDIDLFKDLLNDYGKSIFGVSSDSVAKYHSKKVIQLRVGK